MATVNLITGVDKISGRVGNMVHYVSNGKQCVRTLAQRIFDPHTDKQFMVRSRMSFLSGLAVKFEPAIRVGFRACCEGLNFYNRFMRCNYRYAKAELTQTPEEKRAATCTADMPQLLCAQGNLPAQHLEVFYERLTHSLRVEHVPDTYPAERAECYLVLFQDNLPRVLLINMGEATQLGEFELPLPEMMDPMEMSVYTFCASVESEKCSTSVYVPLKIKSDEHREAI
ncbi:MAG: hypothetical protein ACRDDZ_08775 [Marinifilaceae bacterium]